MEFVVEDNEPFIKVRDGEPQIEFHFSDCISEHLEVFESISGDLENGAKETILSVRFPLAQIVDSEIEGHRLGWPFNQGDRVRVHTEDRAYFDAIKAALQAAIGQIDKIEFVTNGKENAP